MFEAPANERRDELELKEYYQFELSKAVFFFYIVSLYSGENENLEAYGSKYTIIFYSIFIMFTRTNTNTHFHSYIHTYIHTLTSSLFIYYSFSSSSQICMQYINHYRIILIQLMSSSRTLCVISCLHNMS